MPNISTSDQFLRVPEVCELLAINRSMLYRLIKSGDIKRLKIRGATIFSKQQIVEWMQSKVAEAMEVTHAE